MVEKKKFLLIMLLMILGIYGCTTAPHIPTTIYVPDDYSTIQEALDAASTGDTVLVAPGTYYENIIWPHTDDIVLLSECGPDSTIIDGKGGGDVIRIGTGVDSTTVIKGFTIKNAISGIYCYIHSSPTIIGNVITEHITGAREGGGICCKGGSSPLIVNNTISNNTTIGIYCKDSSPLIFGNTITNNSYSLGAIYCKYSSPVIEGNTISENKCRGIHIWAGAPTITGNTITDNFTAGIFCEGGISRSYPVISANIISNNRGDGIYAGTSEPKINNNVISDNLAHGIRNQMGYQVNANYNNITGNMAYGIYKYSCSQSSKIINAEYNWWGAKSGPGGVGPGTGDKVSDCVDYRPWLTEPVDIGQQTKHCTTNVKRRPPFEAFTVRQ
ncbi:MAG TPA: DUF1565 domain-containing protein [bacterium (Candidatus Stahlbacteria)]|nr:DUF1565 domain-containing protein [Candidatus Stahlbacteria bacterium]